jgi:acyl carrier protein
MQTTNAYSIDDRVMTIVRDILGPQAPQELAKDASLAQAGLASLDMVNLMIQIETDFNITIPPRLVTPKSFRSVASICDLIGAVNRAA